MSYLHISNEIELTSGEVCMTVQSMVYALASIHSVSLWWAGLKKLFFL